MSKRHAAPTVLLTRFRSSRSWAYIKQHNLQDPTAKTTIKCDETLKSIFKTDSFKQTAIFGLLAQHVEKADGAKMQ